MYITSIPACVTTSSKRVRGSKLATSSSRCIPGIRKAAKSTPRPRDRFDVTGSMRRGVVWRRGEQSRSAGSSARAYSDPCARSKYRSVLPDSEPSEEEGIVSKIRMTALAIVATAAAVVAVSVAPAGAQSETGAKSCAFTLRIGDVLPFTGDLAAYGANLDRAVRLAIGLQNAALKKDGLAKKIKVSLVGSEDGQTQASASVEAATKLVKSNHANVIIGEMASSATIPMAQSVTIPNKIVQISPTSSAPQITSIADNGFLWRTYPSDTLQGKVLAQAAVDAFAKGTVNVGARNDAFGTALKQLFVTEYQRLGGKIGE